MAPPPRSTAGKGGSVRGETTAGGGDRSGNDPNRVADVKCVLDEVRRLRGENESLHEEVDGLRGDVEAVKENLEALMKKSRWDPSATNFHSATGAERADCPAESDAGSGAVGGAPAKNKKKNRKKKKGAKAAHHYWGAAAGGNLSKIAVGLLAVALFISISIAVGQGGIGKSHPLAWDQKNGQTSTHEDMENAVDSATATGGGIMANKKSFSPEHQQGGEQPINSPNLNVGADSSGVHGEETPTDQGSQGVVENNTPFVQSSTAPENLEVKEIDSSEMSESGVISHLARVAGKVSQHLQADDANPFGPSVASASREQPINSPNLIAGADSSGVHGEGTPTDQGSEGVVENDSPFVQSSTASENLEVKETDSSNLVRVAGKVSPRTLQADDADLFGPSAAPASPSPSFLPENNDEASSPPTVDALLTSNPPSIAQENTGEDGSWQAVSSSDDIYSPDYVCDADPETCGCLNLYQADYRGTISKTRGGEPCASWEDVGKSFGVDVQEMFPDAGLEENFCRNANYFAGGPQCYVLKTSGTYTSDDWEVCDVPACEGRVLTPSPTSSAVPTSSTGPTGSPSSSSIPSSSSSPTQVCPLANNEVCGCEAVGQSDYQGTISTTADGFQCERWDSEWALKVFGPSTRKHNFCRNREGTPECVTRIPNPDRSGFLHYCDIPKCDPCSCMPPCDEPNNQACACPSVLQANQCCDKEDASCKCDYLKDACQKSLENNGTDFCEDAQIACCEGKADPYCKCNMHEQICSGSAGQNTCDFAAGVCCESEKDWNGDNFQCFCDFHTYSSTFSTEGSEFGPGHCLEAEESKFNRPGWERNNLETLYYFSRGEHWIDNTGWLNDTVPHCSWFGIHCNEEGLVDEINLRNNNLTGGYFLVFPYLTKLDLAENKLSGEVKNALDVLFLRQLAHIDFSGNYFSGHADMTFPPSTSYVNFSHNNFTSVGFKRYNPAYETLKVADLSHNQIDQHVSELFLNTPPNIEKLILSDNAMKGALPNPFPLEDVRHFAIADNAISGSLPRFAQWLIHLDLSNQKYQESGGLSGMIPALSNVESLAHLDLAGNKLVGDIPPALGNLQFLKILNISSNALSGSIPSDLSKQKEVLEVLDLSSNKLTGLIPVQLADKDGALVLFHLRGNPNILDPAPLDLCSLPGFDLRNDPRSCPPERNALQEFFVSAKGSEWTESTLWLDPVTSHCDYFGVECNERNNVIKLDLQNNGLSGKLSKDISALKFLVDLNLSDNDIKGSIPAEIGDLTNLKYLRLSHNGFTGETTNFGHLQHLELIQVHGNRLTGNLPRLNVPFSDVSSFVSDCGNPSDFDQSLVCEDCTMCCNAQGDCINTDKNKIQKLGYWQFSGVFIACLFGASAVLALAVYTRDKYQNRHLLSTSARLRRMSIIADKKYALSTMGDDSVYQFFLGKSRVGWMIVILVVGAQMWLLSIFVGGAEIDWTEDKSDFVYTWKCPRDQVDCRDTNDLSWTGWLAFTILMIAHLLKDIINGTKLIVLSAKQRHSRNKRMRFFMGGMIMLIVSAFTFFASTLYNAAIATNNREIIENSVIILFIMDIDEMLYDILMVINPDWAASMSGEEKQAAAVVRQEKDDEEDGLGGDFQYEADQNFAKQDQSETIESLESKLQSLKTEFSTLQETVKQLNAQLNKFRKTPQDEHDDEQDESEYGCVIS